MKFFLKKIFLFIFPILALAYPADYLISVLLSRNATYVGGEYSVWNDLYNGRVNVDLIIHGSSKAWTQFDPFLLQDSLNLTTYNLGIDGHNFALQYVRHQTHLAFNSQPKYLILSVDIFSFNQQSSSYNYNFEQFLPYMLFNQNLAIELSPFCEFSKLYYYIPLIRYSGRPEVFFRLIEAIFPMTPTRIKGFKGQDKIWSDDLKQAKEKSNSFEVKFDNQLIERFNSFLQECKFNGIKVILVYPPEFIEGQEYISNRQEVIDFYQAYSEKFQLLFLDYSKDSLSENKNYFYNSQHLNKQGAALFTKQLIKDLDKSIEID